MSSRSFAIAALLLMLAVVVVPAGAIQFSNTTPFAVDGGTQTSTIAVSGVGTLSEVSVTITFEKISGSLSDCPTMGNSPDNVFNREIFFSLTSPAGTSLVLVKDQSSTQTYTGWRYGGVVDVTFSPTATTVVGGNKPVSGTFIPAGGSMTVFQSEDADGTWTLEAGDTAGGDPLCILGWSLNFPGIGGDAEATGEPVAVPGVAPTHMDGRLNDYEAAGPIAIYSHSSADIVFDVYGIDPDNSAGDYVLHITREALQTAEDALEDEPVLIDRGTIAATGQPVSVYLLPDGLVQFNTFYADGKPYVVTVDPLSDDLEHLQH